jgi:hypothetical protein
MAIELITKDPSPMLIVNVYKPGDKDIIPELHEYLRTRLAARSYSIIIIAGDFNSHHPCWNPREYTNHDEEGDKLLEMMLELELNLLIPAGIITYPNADTAIDLVWGNDEAKNRIIKCQIVEENDHGSDHFPIETIIATSTDPPQLTPSYNYTKTNWKELNNRLESYLSELPTDNENITTQDEVDDYAKHLVEAIKRAIREITPRKRPSPHSKR